MGQYENIRGTTEDVLQIGKGGVQIKNSSGVLEVRNAEDTGYATIISANNILLTQNPARLSLAAGNAITTANITSASTLYWTPLVGQGNQIAIYNGVTWITYTMSEISLALSVVNASNYDVFVYDNAGVLTLELSAAWASNTSRTNALGLQDGIRVKASDHSRRWLGTIRASGTNTCDDSRTKRFCWNFYNQIERILRVLETANSWVVTSTAWQPWNSSTANRVEFVQGNNDKAVELYFIATIAENPGVDNGYAGIGEDSTTVNSASINGGFGYSSPAKYLSHIGLGYHYLQCLEVVQTGLGSTFYGDGGLTMLQAGAIGKIWE